MMEPSADTSRPTIETAKEVGRARIDKFLNWVAPVMAPDVLVEMGKNAAQDKMTEIKSKLESLAERSLTLSAKLSNLLLISVILS